MKRIFIIDKDSTELSTLINQLITQLNLGLEVECYQTVQEASQNPKPDALLLSLPFSLQNYTPLTEMSPLY